MPVFCMTLGIVFAELRLALTNPQTSSLHITREFVRRENSQASFLLNQKLQGRAQQCIFPSPQTPPPSPCCPYHHLEMILKARSLENHWTPSLLLDPGHSSDSPGEL